jgi:hypothetical protein
MTTIAICLRRMSIALTVLGLAVLGLPVAASAAPTFTFKVTAIPIPGFPHTGDILGAGALAQAHLTIMGSEYDGDPPPVIGAKVFAPAGTMLHPQGFATCSSATLEEAGPAGCPKGSAAGPKGSGLGVVSFGGERVPETASVQFFFAPAGGLEMFIDGTTPASIEMITPGRFVSAPAPFGLEFIDQMPLIETLPGAPDGSVLEGTISLGSAYKQGKNTVSYITLPKKCSQGGFPLKAELSFLGGATAEASYKMQCPKH